MQSIHDLTPIKLSSDVKNVTKVFKVLDITREASVVTGCRERIVTLKADADSMGTAEVDGQAVAFWYASSLLVNAEEVEQVSVTRKGLAPDCLGGLEAWKLRRLLVRAGFESEAEQLAFIGAEVGRKVESLTLDLLPEEGIVLTRLIQSRYADQLSRYDNATRGFRTGS